ncbi:MAG: Uma2 family endonuclease [Coleofasciculaceae cyanobacterium SM2_1_6]|nr:Uma2 family endonuclease [Coleofasciculaceae cyanobacterium SM2_1_6]
MLTAEQVTKQIILDFKNIDFSDDQFYQLCQDNQDWRIELTIKGELVIMSPIGGISGKREADLITDLNLWNRRTQLGHVFSSSTIFHLPRGGKRSPDVAWVAKDIWASLTPEAQEKFPPICPNFVIELRSRTDALPQLQEKMQEYLASGLQLGWLINPQGQQVEIYRPQQGVEIVQLPTQLSGEHVLPEFILDLANF